MIRRVIPAVLAALVLAGAAPAQTAGWRFKWQQGQVLTYRTENSTTVAEVIQGNKVESHDRIFLTKRWQVQAVDAQGVARKPGPVSCER